MGFIKFEKKIKYKKDKQKKQFEKETCKKTI